MGDDERQLESVGTDAADRTAAALEEWNKPAEETPPAPAGDQAADKGADGAAAAAAKTEDKAADKAGDKAADGKKADAAGEKDITKAAFFNDPLFQEHYRQSEEWRAQNDALHKVMDEGRYKIDSTATLKAVHEDAFTLYDIASGKKTVDGLLDLFEKNWDPKTFKEVLGQMARYAAAKGVKLEGGDGAGGDEDDNPLAKKVSEIAARVDEREKAEKTAREQAAKDAEVKDRMDTVITPFQTKIAELCKEKGLTEQEDIDDYSVQVMDRIGRLDEKGKKAVVDQIKAGKWGEVQRIFTEYHNLLLKRAERHTNAIADRAKKNSDTIPRVPAGDGGAPAKRPVQRDLRSSEGRTSAALEEWNKPKQ